jgi:DHA3 family tetracycline resistance protein-like MFS transporter
MPAATALMPEIVPEDVLPSANAASSISRSLFGGMLGPALGGLISAWSIPGALAFDVVTFLVSAVTLIMMHPTPTPRESAEAPHMLREIMSGLRFTVATKWLFWTLVGAGLINAALFTPVSTLMPLFLKQEFHASRQLIGSSIALGGVGWVIGSVIVGSLKTPKRRIRWLTVSWVVGTMVVGAISVAHHLVVALVIVFLIGPLLSYGNVMWESMMQTEVPRELLGRVSSVDWFMSLALSPIGVIVAGALSTHIGIRAYFFAAMTLCLPIMALLLLSKSVNEVDATRVAEQ